MDRNPVRLLIGLAALAAACDAPSPRPCAAAGPSRGGGAVVPGPGAPAAPEGVAGHSFAWRRGRDGSTLLAVTVTPSPGWHVYWENPGDSGDAPRITFSLPGGMEAGPIVFPRPEVTMHEGEALYGYHGPVTYLVPVGGRPVAGDPLPACGNGPWRATARVMACNDRCTVTVLEASGDWPVPLDGDPIDLEGGFVDGASLPMSAGAAGVIARLDGTRASVEGPARGASSVRFIPLAVPGMQVALPSGAPAVEGTVVGDRFRIDLDLLSPGVGPGQPALAGMVLLGNGRGDPCVRLAIEQPVAASGGHPPSN